ncbi:MAG: hypothetical protein NTX50_04880 [Candidatus Sumerlaeota bacterium]|nr:hypothetical protein [Candidatus Sumerlaeota bacterium]
MRQRSIPKWIQTAAGLAIGIAFVVLITYVINKGASSRRRPSPNAPASVSALAPEPAPASVPASASAPQPPASAPDKNPFLEGVVRDRETGLPIKDARICRSLGMFRFVDEIPPIITDREGRWRLNDLPPGQVNVVVAAEGYAPLLAAAYVTTGPANSCNTELEPGGTINVIVTDETSAPLLAANVGCNMRGNLASALFFSQQTDSDGRATFENVSILEPPAISVEKTGYVKNSLFGQVVSFPKGSRIMDMKVALRQAKLSPVKPLTFTGRVTNAAGAAVADASVFWSWLDSQRQYPKAQSNSDGTYRFELAIEYSKDGATSLPVKKAGYYLAAFKPGYAPAISHQDPGAITEAPKEVNFELSPAHWLGGVVVNSQGEPIAGIKIEPRFEEFTESANVWRNRIGKSNAVTDEAGRFRFDDLPDQRMTFNLSGKNMTALMFKRLLMDQETRIVMSEGGVIKGVVTDAQTKSPISSFQVKVSWHRGSSDVNDKPFSFQSPDGSFTLGGLNEGTDYTAMAHAPGYVPCLISSMKAANQALAQPATFELTRGREVKGVIINQTTQQPINGAEVILRQAKASRGLPMGLSFSLSIPYLKTTTGDDGAFALREASEPSPLVAAAKGCGFLSVMPDERDQYGGASSLTLVLKPESAFTGVVRYQGVPVPRAWVIMEQRASRKYALRDLLWLGASQWAKYDTRTDDQGRFQFEGYPAGEYQIKAIVKFGQTQTEMSVPFTLQQGERKTVDIELKP